MHYVVYSAVRWDPRDVRLCYSWLVIVFLGWPKRRMPISVPQGGLQSRSWIYRCKGCLGQLSQVKLNILSRGPKRFNDSVAAALCLSVFSEAPESPLHRSHTHLISKITFYLHSSKNGYQVFPWWCFSEYSCCTPVTRDFLMAFYVLTLQLKFLLVTPVYQMVYLVYNKHTPTVGLYIMWGQDATGTTTALPLGWRQCFCLTSLQLSQTCHWFDRVNHRLSALLLCPEGTSPAH